jgi:hypothetical protein
MVGEGGIHRDRPRIIAAQWAELVRNWLSQLQDYKLCVLHLCVPYDSHNKPRLFP